MKLTGLIAAPLTPFDTRGTLAPERIPDYAAFLRDHGVAGVFVNGSTGESLSLALPERKAMAEAWQADKGTLAHIVHVGANSVVEARELAAHAQAIGADAIGAMPPSFFKVGVAGVLDFCEAVAAEAPELPFYYYHIPSLTGVELSVRALLEEGAGRIPNLAGAKFTFENLMDFQQAVECRGGHFDLLFGRDEMLLAGLALGARGAVGSTYSFMAGVYRKLIAAFQANDLATARACQAQSQQLVNVLQESGNGVACCKAIMKLVGVDCGPCRIPLPRFDDAKLAWLKSRLDQIGFFGW